MVMGLLGFLGYVGYVGYGLYVGLEHPAGMVQGLLPNAYFGYLGFLGVVWSFGQYGLLVSVGSLGSMVFWVFLLFVFLGVGVVKKIGVVVVVFGQYVRVGCGGLLWGVQPFLASCGLGFFFKLIPWGGLQAAFLPIGGVLRGMYPFYVWRASQCVSVRSAWGAPCGQGIGGGFLWGALGVLFCFTGVLGYGRGYPIRRGRGGLKTPRKKNNKKTLKIFVG